MHTPEELQFLACISSQVALVVRTLLASIGDLKDAGSIPELGRSPGEGNCNSFQYSCLGNLMDGGAWWAIDRGVVKESDMTQQLSTNTYSF